MRRRARLRGAIKWTGLIVCAATLVAWLLSSRWDFVAWDRWREITVARGRFFYHEWAFRGKSRAALSVRGWSWHARRIEGVTWRERLGLNLRTTAEWTTVRRAVGAPFWMVLIGAAATSATLHRLARPRARPGFCAWCGYDLTGNTSGRCPECGTLRESRGASDRVIK